MSEKKWANKPFTIPPVERDRSLNGDRPAKNSRSSSGPDNVPLSPNPMEANTPSHHSNKRPAAGLSPLVSPAEKRARPVASKPIKQPTAVGVPTNAYDEALSHRHKSRQSSTVGPSPVTHSTRDKEKGSSDQDRSSHTNKSLNKLTTSFQGHSPASASPLSMANGEMEHLSSGNSTPSGAAPPAPRMIPEVQGATLQNVVSRPVSSVAVLRQAASIKRQAQPTSSSEAWIVTQLEKLTHEVKSLSNVKKTLEDEVKSAKERETKLLDRISLLESQDFKQIQKDVTRMADELTRAVKQPDHDNQSKSLNDLKAKVEQQMGENHRVTEAVEKQSTTITSLKGKFEKQMGENLRLTEAVEKQSTTITSLKGMFDQQMRENLRLTEAVEKQSKTITSLKGMFDQQTNAFEEISKKTVKVILDGLLTKQSRDISELIGKLNQQAGELKQQSKDISELGEQMDQMDLLNETLQSHSKQIAEQQAKLVVAETERSDFSGRLDTMEAQVKEHNSAIQDKTMDPQRVLQSIQAALKDLTDDTGRLQALGIHTGLKAALASWFETSLKTSLQPLDRVKHLEVEVRHLKGLEAQVLQTKNVVEILGNSLLVEVEKKLKKQSEELREETQESNSKIERLEREVNAADKQCSVHQHINTPETIETRLKGIEHSLNHLQDRYENMSTQDLYAQLVQWITTTFGNDIDLHANFKVLQVELADLNRTFRWIHDREQPLMQLSSNHQQLLQLLDPQQRLQLNERLLQSTNPDRDLTGANEPGTLMSANHSQDHGAKITDLAEEMKTVRKRLNEMIEPLSTIIFKLGEHEHNIKILNNNSRGKAVDLKWTDYGLADVFRRVINENPADIELTARVH